MSVNGISNKKVLTSLSSLFTYTTNIGTDIFPELLPDKANGWSSWSHYGPCSIDCEKFRQRFCTSSAFSSHCPEADEYGVQTQFVKCSKEECYGERVCYQMLLQPKL